MVGILHNRLHSQWHPEPGLRSDTGAEKALWRHPNDRDWDAVHFEFAADYSGITPKLALPIAITDDGHGTASNLLVVGRSEQMTEHGVRFEYLKIIARDELALFELRLLVPDAYIEIV